MLLNEKDTFGGVLMIGEVKEVSIVDFPNMEEKAEYIIGSIHRIAMSEFMSRDILSMWEWEVRTKSVFEHNHIHHIKDVVTLTLGQVNRLIGCGYKTRKEIYDIFVLYHIKLKNWSPEKHWRQA